jgi:hypothetical protein
MIASYAPSYTRTMNSRSSRRKELHCKARRMVKVCPGSAAYLKLINVSGGRDLFVRRRNDFVGRVAQKGAPIHSRRLS